MSSLSLKHKYDPTTQAAALYHIFRAGAGVDAGVERAYGVRDF